MSGMSQRRRRKLWMRFGGMCYYCGVPIARVRVPDDITGRWFTVDHRVPRALGGSNHDSNLVASCNRCNQMKGSHPVDRFEALRIPHPCDVCGKQIQAARTVCKSCKKWAKDPTLPLDLGERRSELHRRDIERATLIRGMAFAERLTGKLNLPSETIPCRPCFGAGKRMSGSPCPTCMGTGKVPDKIRLSM